MFYPRLSVRRASRLIAVSVAFVAAQALAAPILIPVSNGSFELPDVVNLTNGFPTNQNAVGGPQSVWSYTTQVATINNQSHYFGPNYVNDPVPYWSVTANTGQLYGVGDPVSAAYYGTNGGTAGGFSGLTAGQDYTFNTLAAANSSYGYAYARGYQFAYADLAANGGSAIFTYNPSDPNTGNGSGLSLGNFVPGESFYLTLGVGAGLNATSYSYSVTLLESLNGGSTWLPVGSTGIGNSAASNSGSWENAMAVFNAGPTDNGLIGIQLTFTNNGSTSTEADFDNVQLAIGGPAQGPISPEPASMGLLAIGVIGLIRRR